MLVSDEKLNLILKYIAEHPGASLYDIGDNSGVNRTTAMRKIKEEYKLVENEFLRFEKGKRCAEQYWLTLKGLYYSLGYSCISSSKARDIRLKNKIVFTDVGYPFEILKPLLEDMERDWTDIFYTFKPGNVDVSSSFIDCAPYLASVLTFGFLLESNLPVHKNYIRQHVKGNDFVSSNGGVIPDFEQPLRMIYGMAKSLYQKKPIVRR
jgi:hypothetical protein